MENRQKIPVPRRSFLWSLNETSGEILTHIGPTEFTPSANDRIVRANDRGGYEQAAMEARPFVIARDGEYVLLHNPIARPESEPGAPNGTYVPGGNKERDLSLGTTKIIPGPSAFPLWPGQSAEVRPAHKLGANHYLLVEVVGPLDEQAPYYDLVMKSAGLASVVIDGVQGAGGAVEESERPIARKLRIGQRIVVQGRHTQLFIPPTGIEVVPAIEDGPEAEASDEADASTLDAARRDELGLLLAKLDEGMTNKQFSVLKNELRHRSELSLGERAIMLTALDEAWISRAQGKGKRSDGRRHPHQGPMDPYARKAVVLGPKNFCILFDADGNPRIVKGPARVFPGPHDTFLQRGSRRRVYDAYELGENQALWLRIISPITRAALAERLPSNMMLGSGFDHEHFDAGHELLVRGLPSVFFPFIEAEVLHPDTSEPHVGNDHESVVIDAIGIDPNSGIYVRDKATGKVELVRGESTFLVDPRKQAHVHRRVAAKDWNLWIAASAAHRKSTVDVVTPWALSIAVPVNHAVQISSRQGRRVVVGPANVLLEYDEQLTALSLSKGPHKTGRETISTCLLRVRGGRVKDRFEVVSRDFVRVELELGVAGHFEGDPDTWFAVEDPVKLLAASLRERLREACRALPVGKLLVELPALVGSLLGSEGGLRFADNGMVIDRVELLGSSLAEAKLAAAFAGAQHEAVELELKDEQAKRRLISVRQRDVVDAEEHELQRKGHERMAETNKAELDDLHRVELRKLELSATRERSELELRNQREREAVESRLALAKAETEARAARKLHDAEVDAAARKLVDAVALESSKVQAEIDRATAAALAEADARRLAAVQPQLVGALHAAADAEVMKAAAQNMNLVSLLGGKSPMELFGKLLEGTALSRTVRNMRRRADDPTEPE